jgi:hypothetical protein
MWGRPPVQSRLPGQNPVGVCPPICWRNRWGTETPFGIIQVRRRVLLGVPCRHIQAAPEPTQSAVMKCLLMGTPNGVRPVAPVSPPGVIIILGVIRHREDKPAGYICIKRTWDRIGRPGLQLCTQLESPHRDKSGNFGGVICWGVQLSFDQFTPIQRQRHMPPIHLLN